MVDRISWQRWLCGSLLACALGCNQGSPPSPNSETQGSSTKADDIVLPNPGDTGGSFAICDGGQIISASAGGTGGTGGNGTSGGGEPQFLGMDYVMSIRKFHTSDPTPDGTGRVLTGIITAIWEDQGFFMQEGRVDRNNRNSVEFHAVFVEMPDVGRHSFRIGDEIVVIGKAQHTALLGGVRVLRLSQFMERASWPCPKIEFPDWYVLSPDEVVEDFFGSDSMKGVLVVMSVSLVGWPADPLKGEACRWLNSSPHPAVTVKAPQVLFPYGWDRAEYYLNLTGIFLGVEPGEEQGTAASVLIAPRSAQDIQEQNDACL